MSNLIYLMYISLKNSFIDILICCQKLKNRVAVGSRVRSVWALMAIIVFLSLGNCHGVLSVK